MSESIPTTMRAIKCPDKGQAALVTDAPVPTLKPTYLLVRPSAVAINPTDWKHVDYISTVNGTVGCDYAGTVVAVGEGVQKKWAVGDRVMGFVHGMKMGATDSGSFADYALAKADTQMRLPKGMGDEEACTLGVGVLTVGQGMYQHMGLPWPATPEVEDGKEAVLIYGGSSATGQLGIQFAKLSGFRVLTTCSPRNFDLVKSFGADEVLDYSDEGKAVEGIKAASDNKLMYAWDCISEGNSGRICVNSLAKGGRYGTILPVDLKKLGLEDRVADVKYTTTLGYTINGEPFDFMTMHFDAKPEDFKFGVQWMAKVDELLADGKIKPAKYEVRPGGLDSLVESMDMLRKSQVSGKKLVHRVTDNS